MHYFGTASRASTGLPDFQRACARGAKCMLQCAANLQVAADVGLVKFVAALKRLCAMGNADTRCKNMKVLFVVSHCFRLQHSELLRG